MSYGNTARLQTGKHPKLPLGKLILSFLGGWKSQVSIQQLLSALHKSPAGILQGSPLSAPLFSLFTVDNLVVENLQSRKNPLIYR